MLKVQIAQEFIGGPITVYDYCGDLESALNYYNKLEKTTTISRSITLSLIVDGTEIPLMSRRYK